MFALYDKGKPDTECIRSLNLAMAKHTTVQVTKLPLYHEIRKISMSCSAEPVLTDDLCIVQEEKFSITCCMCEMYT
jgi:hypothetical protein